MVVFLLVNSNDGSALGIYSTFEKSEEAAKIEWTQRKVAAYTVAREVDPPADGHPESGGEQ